VTDQVGRLFRGYVTVKTASSEVTDFFVGVIATDGSINVAVRGSAGQHVLLQGRLDWGSSGKAPRELSFFALDLSTTLANLFTLTKTTP
jgi:hypothetical protein